jgi:hypothetical protein
MDTLRMVPSPSLSLRFASSSTKYLQKGEVEGGNAGEVRTGKRRRWMNGSEEIGR